MHSVLGPADYARGAFLALAIGSRNHLPDWTDNPLPATSGRKGKFFHQHRRPPTFTGHSPDHQETQTLWIPARWLRVCQYSGHRFLRMASVHHQQRTWAAGYKLSFLIGQSRVYSPFLCRFHFAAHSWSWRLDQQTLRLFRETADPSESGFHRPATHQTNFAVDRWFAQEVSLSFAIPQFNEANWMLTPVNLIMQILLSSANRNAATPSPPALTPSPKAESSRLLSKSLSW